MIQQRATPAQTSAPADATGRFFSRSAGTGRRRHGRGAAPVLDSRFSDGADAGEKATFSLTYGEARRKILGHSHLRKVVSVSLWEAILVCLRIMRRRCKLRRENYVSLIHDEIRREKSVYVHLRKVVSAPSGPSLHTKLSLSGEAGLHTSLAAVRRRAVVSASLREVILGFLPLCAGEVAPINETARSQMTGRTQTSE